MKRMVPLLLLLALGFCGAGSPAIHAAQTNEPALIKILQSTNASPAEKDEACGQLKLIGTGRSINALAALLTDDKLSHSARYALESMPDPAAGKALLKALPRTSGLLQVGIINSLAVRAEPSAVPQLGKLLSSTDTPVAVAAASALGRIGGPKALAYLQPALGGSSGQLHDAVVDSVLACANRLPDSGKPADAFKIFESLYSGEKAPNIRIAAFRGMILTSGNNQTSVLIDAIAGKDAAARSAALHLAAGNKSADLTIALAELLPKAQPPLQVALIECLVLRADPVASRAVAKLADSPDADVRLAAIRATGSLGDDSLILQLAGKAASAKGDERKAARQALIELNRGPVTRKLLESLKTAPPGVKTEMLLALGGRGDQTALPVLFDLAATGNATESVAALQALGTLAGAAQIPRLVELIADARSNDTRSAGADALAALYIRVQTPDSPVEVSDLVKTVLSGRADTRVALLPVCSEVVEESVRRALRSSAMDSDARIRSAAIHALCDTRDAALLPDLLNFACDKEDVTSRPLAIRGCVRLATQEESVELPNQEKIRIFSRILETPISPDEKRIVLSGLGAIGDKGALTIATPLLNDTAVQAEAEQAVLKIATAIASSNPAEAKAALNKLLALPVDSKTRTDAEAALKKIK